MLLLKQDLIEAKLGLLSTFFLAVEYISILIVFSSSIVLSNNLGALRLLRFFNCADTAEPYLLYFTDSSEYFLKLFSCGGYGYIPYEDSSSLPLFQLQG